MSPTIAPSMVVLVLPVRYLLFGWWLPYSIIISQYCSSVGYALAVSDCVSPVAAIRIALSNVSAVSAGSEEHEDHEIRRSRTIYR